MHGAWRSRGAAVAQPSVAAMELAGRAESIEAILASPAGRTWHDRIALLRFRLSKRSSCSGPKEFRLKIFSFLKMFKMFNAS